MGSRGSSKSDNGTGRHTKGEDALLHKAAQGDRQSYLKLFLEHLPELDRFVHHQVRFMEDIGAVERGLVDPCAIIDQLYIAAYSSLRQMPESLTFRTWLRFLALRILKQQVRTEHLAEPAGLALEREFREEANVDSDLWEFYQPDDVVSVEDTVSDGSAADPLQWLEQRETANEIEAQMNMLPAELGEAVRLRLLDGLDAGEIAALKHQPMDTVRQAIRDACAAIRQNVDQPSA